MIVHSKLHCYAYVMSAQLCLVLLKAQNVHIYKDIFKCYKLGNELANPCLFVCLFSFCFWWFKHTHA